MIKNWAVKSGILFFVFFVLFGCASLPQPDEMKAAVATYQLPKLPEAGKAIVYVVRPSSYFGVIRLKVFLDNQDPKSEMGSTMGSQYIYFSLMPGEHKILSKGENWAETNVSAKAGDIIFIQQEPAMPIFSGARNKLFNLNDYEGKYHVKNLNKGTNGTVTAQAQLEQSAETGNLKGAQVKDSSTSAQTTGSSLNQTGTLPAGKAAVYIYHSGGSNHRFFLLVNGKDITSLRKGQYFAYITEPGVIEFTAKTMGACYITLNAKAGQAYYLKGSVPPGFSPTPSLVFVSPEVGAQEIANCKLISSP
jgi:hypothetical protein